MRKILGPSLTLGLLLVPVALGRADGPDAARAVLEQAIKAHGGAEALAKTRAMVQQQKGEIVTAAATVPFTGEVTIQGSDLGRWSFELDAAGQAKIRAIFVLNRDKGWRLAAGSTKELSKEELEDFRDRAYAHAVATLLPLREKSFELAPLPEIQINGQPALGVKVSSKGHNDIKLYFDKRTQLLVKLERRGRESGLDLNKENFFSDHKEFEGVKLPTRQVELSNGKRAAAMAITGYRFPTKLEDSLFAKP